MKYKKEYDEFIETFQKERDFFKCHEILEDIWVAETECNTRKHVSINLLLLSVGLLHWQRKNYNGALKVLGDSLNNYENVKSEINAIGIDAEKLEKSILENLEKIRLKEEYSEIYLPML